MYKLSGELSFLKTLVKSIKNKGVNITREANPLLKFKSMNFMPHAEVISKKKSIIIPKGTTSLSYVLPHEYGHISTFPKNIDTLKLNNVIFENPKKLLEKQKLRYESKADEFAKRYISLSKEKLPKEKLKEISDLSKLNRFIYVYSTAVQKQKPKIIKKISDSMDKFMNKNEPYLSKITNEKDLNPVLKSIARKQNPVWAQASQKVLNENKHLFKLYTPINF